MSDSIFKNRSTVKAHLKKEREKPLKEQILSLLSTKGRASPIEFLGLTLAFLLIVLFFIGTMKIHECLASIAIVGKFFSISAVHNIFFLPLIGLMTLQHISLCIRRLHDMNISGYLLIPYLMLQALIAVGLDFSMQHILGRYFNLTSTLILTQRIGIVAIITCLFWLYPGTKGDNDYGKMPH